MKKSTGKIIYCGAFRYPEGDAAAQRVRNVGKSLRDVGYDVEFLGWDQAKNAQHDAQYDSDGFRYRVFGEMRSDNANPRQRALNYLRKGRLTLRYLAGIDLADVDAIICYNANSFFLGGLSRLCHKHAVRLLTDCTEWYDPDHLPGGKYGPVALDEAIRMRWLTPRPGGGIVISSYLQDYYSRKGAKVVVVPPAIDINSSKWTFTGARVDGMVRSASTPLQFVYAGNPGRKDKIEEILLALQGMRQRGRAVHMTFVGPRPDTIAALLGERAGLLEGLDDMLLFTGRIPSTEVPALIRKSHFSVLIRPDKRYARAGFPTKLVESLAAGTPVITTATGDEGRYVIDGENGFTIASTSLVQCLTDTMQRAADLDHQEWAGMAEAARKTAETKLDYRCFSQRLQNYLQDIGLRLG